MPKNKDVIDYKPENEAVIDYKPRNEAVVDWKPKNAVFDEKMTDRLYSMTLGQNQWLGFSALTYPVAINITSPKSP